MVQEPALAADGRKARTHTRPAPRSANGTPVRMDWGRDRASAASGVRLLERLLKGTDDWNGPMEQGWVWTWGCAWAS